MCSPREHPIANNDGMSTPMDEPKANADDETPAMNGNENAAADAPVESAPSSDEQQVSAQADTTPDIPVFGADEPAAEPAPKPAPAPSSRRRQQDDDDDDVYIPPVKPETMTKSEASARPAL